ncbi:hypothetical protein LAZ67_3005783 [Cordylochernes scorpioides]|uniref:PiggyBac transposable element-derived protein domain-containing protein n=1 Tax=Cordylochernes scorpioides TaxID=51811 RepID=A0ABY6KAK0_9ARAC|nr:hypothetical protein LAZ67_3005783 [Cordylochernes scorpioides]
MIFNAVMSERSEERKILDKLAAIRELWNKFNENCSKVYTISTNSTIDEDLLRFRVLSLIDNIAGTNKNINDNWYTSYELALELKKTAINFTCIPKAFLVPTNEGNAQYGFDQENVTLLSFTPKPHKIIKKAKGQKLWLFYNATKGGVDTHDFLCAKYSTSRKLPRWPMRIFYSMLDSAA